MTRPLTLTETCCLDMLLTLPNVREPLDCDAARTAPKRNSSRPATLLEGAQARVV